MEQQKKRRAYQHHCSRPNQSRRVSSRWLRWSNKESDKEQYTCPPMLSSSSAREYAVLVDFLNCLHYLRLHLAGPSHLRVIGSITLCSIIDTPRPDPMPTERPVDQSPIGLQRKDHAETIEDIRENPREREGESRTKRHIIQLEYPEGAQKEKEKETGADATRQEGTGILLNSDIRGRIAVAPKRISTNPPSLPLDEITPPRRAIFSNAAAFNVSIEGRDVVHALQPPRHYNSPSLLQRSDWLSQCSTGSVGADCVTDFVMETVALRR
ncbi:hypothetical protein BU17DRAFT_64176 [Hysterangium stoloniferum]|nr:hypothetical protein BU17DRAFT_64176 [Hysterangium stoloniferum]